jgi:hypothetical protein
VSVPSALQIRLNWGGSDEDTITKNWDGQKKIPANRLVAPRGRWHAEERRSAVRSTEAAGRRSAAPGPGPGDQAGRIARDHLRMDEERRRLALAPAFHRVVDVQRLVRGSGRRRRGRGTRLRRTARPAPRRRARRRRRCGRCARGACRRARRRRWARAGRRSPSPACARSGRCRRRCRRSPAGRSG